MLLKLQEEKKTQKADFYAQLADSCKAIAQNYTKEKRLQRFKTLFSQQKGKKIIMVSDFINPIGGIETYIHDVKSLLEAEGYEVKLFGSRCPRGKRGKLKKLLGIGFASFNFWQAISFFFFIQKEKPDLIWYHSMLRRNGWLPLAFTYLNKAEKWMMYHDFGYFTPYPHQLARIEEIETPLTLRHYLQMAKTKNPLRKFFIFGKYLTLYLLKVQLKKQIARHLVPSAFMIPLIEKSFELQKGRVEAFNHFLQSS